MISIILTALAIAALLDALTYRFALRMIVLRWRARRVVLLTLLIGGIIVLEVYGDIIINVLAVSAAVVVVGWLVVTIARRLNAATRAMEAETARRRDGD